jgi:zona occludens toxin
MSLNQTASISLLTGLPGAGKTLRLIQFIVGEIESGKKTDKDGESHPAMIYVCNVKKINIPGIIPWHDPMDWESLPAGATLIVDEAQDYFPRRRSGEPTAQVKQMSKIRHSGVRLVLATQDPSYLDQHLLGLVGFHEHLLRLQGKNKTFIFRHNTVMENIRKPFKVIKTQYDHEQWELPASFFQYYESAELHTIKYRMPALMKKALILGPLSVAMVFGVWFFIFRDGYAQAHMGKAASEAKAGPAGLPTTSAATLPQSVQGAARSLFAETAGDYAKNLTPVVDGIPWTAPAWINRPVRSDPHVYCMASGAGQTEFGYKGASVTCITEQGTRFDMAQDRARALARSGEPYNPFKEAPRPERPEQKEQAKSGSNGAQAGGGVQLARPADVSPFYGGMRAQVGSAPPPQGL